MCLAKHSALAARKLRLAETCKEIPLSVPPLLNFCKFCSAMSWVVNLLHQSQAENSSAKLNFWIIPLTKKPQT